MKLLQQWILLCLVFTIACTSAKEAYQKGDYAAAVKKSMKELKAEKNVSQNTQLLNNAFQRRYQELHFRFTDRKLTDLTKLKKLYWEIDEFLELATEARPYLNEEGIEQKQQLTRDEDQLEFDICTEIFEKTMEHYDTARLRKDKNEARMAHEGFIELASFDTQKKYKESQELIERSLEMAIYNYQFEIDHGFNIGYSWKIKNQFSRVVNKGSTYKQFFVDADCKPCDCVIELNFRELRESQFSSRESKSFEKKIEDGFTTTKDDKGNTIKVPIYKILRGQVIADKTRYDFNWEIRADVNKETSGCDATYNTFDASRSLEIYEYSLNGDREAIPAEYKNYSRPILDKDDIIDDLLEDLFNKVVNYYD